MLSNQLVMYVHFEEAIAKAIAKAVASASRVADEPPGVS